MSYLRSLEYKEARDNLKGEFQEVFQSIEEYYIELYTENSYEVQLTLSQIMADFLMAQDEGRPLSKITGGNTRNYAIKMLDTELDTNKGLSYWILMLLLALWTPLFLMFFRVINYEGYSDYSLAKKLDNMYVTLPLLVVLIIGYALYYIKSRINKALFYKRKLIKLFNVLISIVYIYSFMLYFESWKIEDSKLGIWIPGPLFTVLISLTTIAIFVAIVFSYRNTKKKRTTLESSSDTELIPEQVVCPSCSKEHDLDYPKCPYCGFRNNTIT